MKRIPKTQTDSKGYQNPSRKETFINQVWGKTCRNLRTVAIFIVFLFLLGQWGFISPNHLKLSQVIPTSVKPMVPKTVSMDQTTQMKLNESYGRLPLSFEINNGQNDPQMKFMARGKGYSLYLTQAEAVLTLKQPARRLEDAKKNNNPGLTNKSIQSRKLLTTNPALRGPEGRSKGASLLTTASDVIRMRLVGGNRLCRVEGIEKLPGISNYFIGNDSSKWRTNVAQYAKVKLKDVYPGIDMVYYGNQGKLEYDFVVKPGADPNVIKVAWEGVKDSRLNDGNLVLRMGKGDVVFKAPVVYQEKDGERKPLPSRYAMAGKNMMSFEVDSYDPTQPLIIDPQLDYSTYLGGSSQDRGSGIAVDSSGNAYVTGWAYSADFPTTAGAYQTTYGTGQDVFITKLNSAGTGLIYSTYLGGNDIDYSCAIALDSSECAYVAGYTRSSNLPTSPGAYQTTKGGGVSVINVFVAKLNATGTSLIYSTYLGGNEGQDQARSIAVDSNGNAYVTGITSEDFTFPTTAGAYKTAIYTNSITAFVTKLNATGTALVYSTYLSNGGSWAAGIAVDGSGNAYVTGNASGLFPTTAGAYQTTHGGGIGIDAFITKLNATGTGLIYSTYLGGSAEDYGQAVAVDSGGNAYVTGYTVSTDFPTTAGSYQSAVSYIANYGGIPFVTKLNATGTALIYSTFMGFTQASYEYGYAIALDSDENAYITGSADCSFPTTSGAYQPTCSSYPDAFVSKLNATGAGLVYSTFLGGNGNDYGQAIALDSSGNVYVTGYTSSGDFPMTAGAYQSSFAGLEEAFIVKFDYTAFYTPTQTFTSTESPTSTPTATGTITLTPIPSQTPSPTPSSTMTETASATPSRTATQTRTSTPTPTTTPTVTPPMSMTLSKQVTPEAATGGGVLTYTLNLAVSQSTALNTAVTDFLPSNLTYLGPGINNPPSLPNPTVIYSSYLVWNLPSLAPGNYQLSYQAKVDDFVVGGTVLTNQVAAFCPQLAAPVSASAAATITASNTVRIVVNNEAGSLVKDVLNAQFSQPVTEFSLLCTSITSLYGECSRAEVYYGTYMIAAWDGTDAADNLVTNGTYVIKADSVDSYGVTTSVSHPVTVDRIIFSVRADVVNQSAITIRHLYNYIDDPGLATDPLVGLQVFPTVFDPGLSQVAAVIFGNGVTVAWDGKDDSSSLVVPGCYFIEARYSEGTTFSQVTVPIAVVSDPGMTPTCSIMSLYTPTPTPTRTPGPPSGGDMVAPPADGSYVAPQPVKGDTALVVYSMGASGKVKIRVFNILGELVARLEEDKPAGVQVTQLTTGNYAPGIYLYKIDINYGFGWVQSLPVGKFLVVR